MTDRELLELAAKAAGYVLVWGDKYKLGDDEIDCTDISYIRSGQPDEGDVFWNPLIDDGDALRLAVKLGIALDFFYSGPMDAPTYSFTRARRFTVEETDGLPDSFSATRRAIVRAAAEIQLRNQKESYESR